MTMVDVRMQWPRYPVRHGNAYMTAVDGPLSTTQKIIAFPILGGGQTIKTIDLYFDAVTVAQDVRLEIQLPDTSGNPSGVEITDATGSRSPVATSWNTFTFASEVTLTRGILYFLALDWVATEGTLVEWRFTATGNDNLHQPFYYNGSAWAGAGNAQMPTGRFKSTAGTYQYVENFVPHELGVNTFKNVGPTGSAREIGMRFQVPFACRIYGMEFTNDPNATTDLAHINFYADTEAPGAGTTLHFMGDRGGGEDDLLSGTIVGRGKAWFKTQQTLAKDTWYKITIDSNVTNQNFYVGAVESGGMLAMAGTTNIEVVWTDDDSTWETAVDTQFWPCVLLIDQIDDGTGSGGVNMITASPNSSLLQR